MKDTTLPGFYMDLEHNLVDEESTNVVIKEKKIKVKKPYIPGSQYNKAINRLKELTEIVK